jgi:hypothetical protein
MTGGDRLKCAISIKKAIPAPVPSKTELAAQI